MRKLQPDPKARAAIAQVEFFSSLLVMYTTFYHENYENFDFSDNNINFKCWYTLHGFFIYFDRSTLTRWLSFYMFVFRLYVFDFRIYVFIFALCTLTLSCIFLFSVLFRVPKIKNFVVRVIKNNWTLMLVLAKHYSLSEDI